MGNIGREIDKLGRTARKRTTFRAMLGDGQNNLIAYGPDDVAIPGYVMARIQFTDEASATVRRIRCRKVGAQYGAPVIVGYGIDGELEAIEEDPVTGIAFASGRSLNVPNHNSTHSIQGNDPVFVKGEQILPGLTHPTNPPSLSVYVKPFHYSYAGVNAYWAGGEVDLTSYLPTGGGEHRLIIISFNPSTVAMDVDAATAIVPIVAGEETLIFDDADIQAVSVDAGNWRMAAIRLHTDQTQIMWKDWVKDIRQLFNGFDYDHGRLVGLSDDDHSQYLLLAGRSGGQTAYGDTASGGNLTLNSTSAVTKGKVLIGGNTLRVDEALATIGVLGAAVAAQALTVYTGADANKGLQIRQNSATQSANLLEVATSAGSSLGGFGSAGFLGVGTSPSTNIILTAGSSSAQYAFDIAGTSTSSTASPAGERHVITMTGAGTNPAGMFLQTIVQPGASFGSVYGLLQSVQLSVTANNVTSLFGTQLNVATAVSYSGTLTTAIAYDVAAPAFSGSKPTTNIGVRIGNMGLSSISNSYGLRIIDQTGSTSLLYAIQTNAGKVEFNAGGDASTDFVVHGDTLNAGINFKGSLDALGIGGAGVSAQKLTVYTGADANKGVVIKANSATQSGDLQQWQNSSATVLAGMSSGASLFIGTTSMPSTVSKLYVTESVTNPTPNNMVQLAQTIISPANNAIKNMFSARLTVSAIANAFNGEAMGYLAEAWLGGGNTQNWTGSGGADQSGLVAMRAKTEVRSGAIGTIGWIQTLLTDSDFNSVAGIAVTNWVGWRSRQPVNVSGTTLTNAYGLKIEDLTVGATKNVAIETNAGLVIFNEGGHASADFRVEGDTDANLLFTKASTDRFGVGLAAPSTKVHALLTDAGTNAVVNVLTVGHDSSGTPAAGFGAGIIVELHDSTTVKQSAGRLTYEWVTATHATRAALSKWTVFDTAEREGIRLEASGTVVKLGFFGANAVIKPTALTTTLTSITHTAPGTPDYAIQDFVDVSLGAGWAFKDHDEANSVLKVILNLQTRINELEAKLQGLGLLT